MSFAARPALLHVCRPSPVPPPAALSRLWLLAVVLVVSLPGCIESTFVPQDAGSKADLFQPDAETDAVADSNLADTAPDGGVADADTAATDVAETDAASSDAADAEPVDLDNDSGEDNTDGTAATDAGPIPLATGQPCTVDSACASDLCLTVSDPAAELLGVTANITVCSEPCNGTCPAGTRCGIDIATGSTTAQYCLPLPADLCKPCSTDSDCAAERCVVLAQSKESLCALPCVVGGLIGCPVGFVCQGFAEGDACVPATGTCSCTPAGLGLQWPCAVTTALGSCGGSQLCSATGWSQCDAPLPVAESCDGADNDCDGSTDNAWPNLGKPCGQGICASKLACSTDGKGTTCPGDSKKQAKETCNDNLDNDCDGQTDEGCPPKDVDGDGTPDGQDCVPYNAAYHPATNEPCCALLPRENGGSKPVSVATKICDFDCNGFVQTCAESDKDGDGFSPPVDCNDTDPLIFPGAKDLCFDGVDQDCDGEQPTCTGIADEDSDGFNKDYDCDDGAGSVYPGAQELCNNIDDNCDGVIDDGNPGGGIDCGPDVGACVPGTLVCSHASGAAPALSCSDAVGGVDETCNGQDDDCDGATDEDFPDLGKPCDSPDSDLCKNGVFSCNTDGDGLQCAKESALDIQELCKAPDKGNGVDEDCDGQVDEVCYGKDIDSDGYLPPFDCNDLDSGYNPGVEPEPCCDPALGTTSKQAMLQCDRNCDGTVVSCGPGDLDLDGFEGTSDCDETDPTRHDGAAEKCDDGVDQDCNGVDLTCAEIAAVDTDGDGFAPPFDCSQSPDIHPFATEICDGKDNNCDGVTDEGNPGAKPGLCGPATGVCQPGQEVCVRIGFAAQIQCVAKVAPGPELCNGKDDNCNGQTDEYFVGLGQECDGDDADLCANGVTGCGPNGTEVICVAETVQNLYELCNDLDDDCDGKTDEDLTYFDAVLGDDCNGLGLCGKGKVVCSPQLQVPVCSTDQFGTEPQSQTEQCNGVDDDCDGLTDEDSLFGGKPVGGPCKAAGACAQIVGTVECGPAGKAICSTMPDGSAFAGSAEVCDGKDNNCDGHIDEGLTTEGSSCKQLGVCALGGVQAVCKSGVWSCSYANVVGYQGESEGSCDSQDNDCDGLTDEDFDIGLPCDGPDSDACEYGLYVCSSDQLGKVCGNEEVEDIPELCNNKDDDCDQAVDEDFDLGAPCDGNDLDLCKTGTWTCGGDGSAVCTNETSQNNNELCDGLDNDCDGQTDETWPDVGQPCDGTDSDSCKNGTVVCTSATTAACGAETVSNIAEFCDSVDNDCDGETDEGNLYQGKALGEDCSGIGACGAGKVVCAPVKQVATCSTNPDAYLIYDGQELCDNVDNDCNGLTDDNLTWQGLAKGQPCPAIGSCGAGVVECGLDGQVVCSTHLGGSAVMAGPEDCNNKDDDCDGQTDEELTVEGSACFGGGGVCASGGLGAVCQNGAWQCNYSAIVGWQATETLCDGLDNDCDGQTDEGFQVGTACDGDDSDSCKNGIWACAADQKSAVCNNESATNIPEVCDGQDNDCDGQTDDGMTYGPGKLTIGTFCKGVGVCGIGQVVCGANLTATCSTDPDGPASQATPEQCDNLDNDCDGKIDDGLTYGDLPVGSQCEGLGECGVGVVLCNTQSKTAVCSTNPDGVANQSKPESCDNKDNDCDGTTDEDIDKSKSTCSQLGLCATALIATCQSGVWGCSYDAAAGYQTTETLCDDLDNDCDGVTDEGFALKGQACDGDDPDSCKSGAWTCTDNKFDVVCVEPPAGVSGPEICDGKDNDCNGQTDELFPTKGTACDGLDSDLCANGSWTCKANGSGVECVNEFILNLAEVCDNDDNDCDGQTDEGLGLGQPCDGTDNDSCANGIWTCGSLGSVQCGVESKVNIAETCNNLDDDCDGTTDEGFELKGTSCDSAADADTCKTGAFQCSQSGVLTCQGDVACVTNATCSASGSSAVPDTCRCGTGGSPPMCGLIQGDSCNAASQSCTCKGGPACPTGQKCASGGCVPL